MKLAALIFSLFTLTFAHADEFKTQDNIVYLIVVDQSASFKNCVKSIKRISKQHGSGEVEALETIGIVNANLSSYGLDIVKELECVLSVEPEGEVEANPRLGRNN
jgi:hypothetical protein